MPWLTGILFRIIGLVFFFSIKLKQNIVSMYYLPEKLKKYMVMDILAVPYL